MAIVLNDNIKINAGKPVESKYLTSGNTAYLTTAGVNAAVSIPERYTGLTVNVGGVEYWYKDGVLDLDLVEKKYGTVIPTGDFITGATNLGYFSGYTGVQILPITHLTFEELSGDYCSLYNYYYRGVDGIIHIGEPNDGIPRRGFVKCDNHVKSWVWNDYVDGDNNLRGWLLINGDVSKQVGTFQCSANPLYYNGLSTFPYQETDWLQNAWYNNMSLVTISNISGSLSTGNTLTIGGRPYSCSQHNNLHFRTVISETPEVISVWDDEVSIRLSGTTTQISADNVGSGVPVYAGTVDNTFLFSRLVQSGSTRIIEREDKSIIIYSSGDSRGGDVYDLSSPAAITVGGIQSGTDLIGKTAIELFEELLVPTLYPTLTNPSGSINMTPSGIFEIGCIIPTITVTGNFNAGCICPQYTATCDKRSCGASAYCFTGAQVNGCHVCVNNSDTEYVTSYAVLSGVQTWEVKTHYNAGVQPFDSKNNQYCTPLPIGVTCFASANIDGILPWYWGLSETCSVNGTCIATCGRNGDGCKCVGNVTTSPISICFNSSADDYIWFALPACADIKTCWWVSGINNGCIGGTGNLFKGASNVSVTSSEGCWSGCNYNVYVSCYKSGKRHPYTFRYSSKKL